MIHENRKKSGLMKETQCVHSGTISDTIAGGVNTPIFPSSAFEYLGRAEIPYPRYFNTPNQKAVVDKICALEGAEYGVLFSSGMAAMSTTILAFAGAGDHVVMMDELYGGTHAFATDEFGRFGIECTFAPTDADAVSGAVRENTRVIVIESPTNPLLSIINIKRVAEFARKQNVITVIDNTFASPINQNPLKHGIDVVVHSGTKYLGGHSDMCCGVAVTTKKNSGRILALARHLGGSVNAFTCHILERSLKTLAIRVERQTHNAGLIARFLEGHAKVRKVNYPGLPASPFYKMARAQMDGFGAMLSFEPDVNSRRFLNKLRLITPAVSLGGIETTICAPADTSHAKMSAAERKRVGISDSLLRLSVGIEAADDLIEDIDKALSN